MLGPAWVWFASRFERKCGKFPPRFEEVIMNDYCVVYLFLFFSSLLSQVCYGRDTVRQEKGILFFFFLPISLNIDVMSGSYVFFSSFLLWV